MAEIVRMAEPRLERDEIDAALAVLESGQLRQGARTREFEEAFAAFQGSRHAYACSSGTAALHLAYLSLVEPGAEVLVPAFTFIATASAVVLAGATPVFCDVDPETFTIDLRDAAQRITDRTRAICPVHLFGQPLDPSELRAFAAEHGVELIGDVAQALGSSIDGRMAGTECRVAAHSLYPTKNLFVGEGGMVTTDDADLDERGRLLRSHGQHAKYRHSVIGLNYRMTDVEAAIGLAQLPKVPARNDRRRAIAARYDEAFAAVPGIRTPAVAAGAHHTYHQYTVILDPAALGDRDAFASRLLELGVESQVNYPLALHEQPAFGGGQPSLPVVEGLCTRVLSLPVHHRLTEDAVEHVVQQVTRVVDERVGRRHDAPAEV